MLRASFVTAILLLAGVHVHAVPVQSPADQPRVDSDSAIAVEGCSALPNYNNATNIAGPWNIRTSRCRNGNDSQESCEIEGLAAGCDVTRSADEKGIERGSVRRFSFLAKVEPGANQLAILAHHREQFPRHQKREHPTPLQWRTPHV